MVEADISLKGTKEGDSAANQHGHACDRDSLNETRAQKVLNCNSAIHIKVAGTLRCKLCNNLGWSAGHLFDSTLPEWRQVESSTAQDNDAFCAIRPFGQGEDDFEGLAPDDDNIDGGYELIVAVGFASTFGQKIELTIRTGDESVEADADEYGCLDIAHRRHDNSFLRFDAARATR